MAAGAAVPMPSPSSLLAASNKISAMASAAAFSTQSLQLLWARRIWAQGARAGERVLKVGIISGNFSLFFSRGYFSNNLEKSTPEPNLRKFRKISAPAAPLANFSLNFAKLLPTPIQCPCYFNTLQSHHVLVQLPSRRAWAKGHGRDAVTHILRSRGGSARPKPQNARGLEIIDY